MTTLVTRLYEDAAHADAVVATLKAEGFPDSSMDVIEQGSRTSAEEQIVDAGVPAHVAQQYAQHLAVGRGLLIVRAPFAPFGAAKTAVEAADAHPSFDAGVTDENMNIPDEVDRDLFLSILPSHRLFLTNMLDVRNDLKARGLSAAFRIPTLSQKPKKRMRPAVMDARFGAFLVPLLSRHRLMTKRPLTNRFFADFIVQHTSNWGFLRPSKMKHFRITN